MKKKPTKAQIAITQAFIKLMKTHPFEKISVSEIISESKYSRTIFYSHYDDKYDLVKKIIDTLVDECVEYTLHTVKVNSTLIVNDKVFTPALYFFTHVYENKDAYSLIFDGKFPNLTIHDFCMKISREFENKVDFEISNWSEDINKSLFYYIRTNVFLTYVQYWNASNFEQPIEYMAEQIRFYLNLSKETIVTAKPHASPN